VGIHSPVISLLREAAAASEADVVRSMARVGEERVVAMGGRRGGEVRSGLEDHPGEGSREYDGQHPRVPLVLSVNSTQYSYSSEVSISQTRTNQWPADIDPTSILDSAIFSHISGIQTASNLPIAWISTSSSSVLAPRGVRG